MSQRVEGKKKKSHDHHIILSLLLALTNDLARQPANYEDSSLLLVLFICLLQNKYNLSSLFLSLSLCVSHMWCFL